MNKIGRFILLIVLGLTSGWITPTHARELDPGQLSVYVGQLLNQYHLSGQKLDDDMSQKTLNTYLEALDYGRMFFTAEDVAFFEKEYGTVLDDEVMLGIPKAPFQIYEVYKTRVKERVDLVNELLKKDYDFTSDRTYSPDRKDAPWPKSGQEVQELWEKRIEGELLQAKLNEVDTRPGPEIVKKRYDEVLRSIDEYETIDILSMFLSALARTYDPHSEYLSPSALENFEIQMRLSLVGIGAVLRSEDGFAKIVELVPGGPAERSGKLKVNDRIAAVGQGDEEFTDTMDMKLDKVVQLIRGEKNTKVRLQVVPAKATDPSARTVVELIRDEVKIKDQEAKAELIEHPLPGGRTQRLGWITLPGFYAEMGAGRATTDPKSTTKDVQALLERLKKEGIEGLVIDLRRNGGGSLQEAINLTGLFIKRGPVVQSKDAAGLITTGQDLDSRVHYDGPMIVLTSKLSASASEIFAAALQDYNRAVVIGDSSTFGKGTVQQMLPIGSVMAGAFGRNNINAGALKLTIQKFYRVSGGSTQFKGVYSDIVIPTLTDVADVGEASLDFALPYDEVQEARFREFADSRPYLDELRKRSQERIQNSLEFKYIQNEIVRFAEKRKANEISLNEEKRRQEIAEIKALEEKQKAERAALNRPKPVIYSITLDNLNAPELILASAEKPAAPVVEEVDIDPADEPSTDEDEDYFDAEREEALNVLSDLTSLWHLPNTSTAQVP